MGFGVEQPWSGVGVLVGDEDGIGGLETKKEATARLEPVGRRRATRPQRAVRMTNP